LFVLQWEGKVERAQEEFESMSKVIKKELETFEAARVKDFKKTIVKYLESLLSHQQEVWKYFIRHFTLFFATYILSIHLFHFASILSSFLPISQ
jgi:hypothetical protein